MLQSKVEPQLLLSFRLPLAWVQSIDILYFRLVLHTLEIKCFCLKGLIQVSANTLSDYHYSKNLCLTWSSSSNYSCLNHQLKPQVWHALNIRPQRLASSMRLKAGPWFADTWSYPMGFQPFPNRCPTTKSKQAQSW